MMIELKRFKSRLENAKYAYGTIKRKVSVLTSYKAYLDENDLEPCIKSLDTWADELFGLLEDGSVNCYVYDVLGYFDVMMMPQDEKLIELLKKRLPSVVVDEDPDFLDFDEWDAIMADVRKNEPIHHYLIFNLLYEFTRRPGEVIQTPAYDGLKWEDIDFDNNSITFRILKKGKRVEVTFKLPDYLKEELLEYRQSLLPSRRRGPVFKVKIRAVEYAFERCLKRAKIKTKGRKLSLKIFRHTRITHSEALGIPIGVVSKHMARHSRIETTMRYYRGMMKREIEEIPTVKDIMERRKALS